MSNRLHRLVWLQPNAVDRWSATAASLAPINFGKDAQATGFSGVRGEPRRICHADPSARAEA